MKGFLSLTNDQLIAARAHKYRKSGVTLLEPLFNPFYESLAKFIPTWITPNTITVVGFLFLVAGTLILGTYNQNCDEYSPNRKWLHWVLAWSAFLGNLMDCLDGPTFYHIS